MGGAYRIEIAVRFTGGVADLSLVAARGLIGHLGPTQDRGSRTDSGHGLFLALLQRRHLG